MNIFKKLNLYTFTILLLYLALFYTPSTSQSLSDDTFDQNYIECGKNINIDKSSDFIFKTTNSRNPPGRWPWLVSMGHLTAGGEWSHSCGGSLVTPQHVITAAHCYRAFVEKMGEISIRAGDSHLKNDTDDAGVQIVKVTSFIVNPGYKYPNRYADIGVLVLEHPVKLTAVVRTICLPDGPTLKETDYEKSFTVTGWGEDDQSKVGEDLYDVSVQVYPEVYCNSTHLNEINRGQAIPQGFTSELFCGADPDGHSEGTCHGDSGSPAVLFQPLNQRYVLRGVVSGGFTCGTLIHPNIYVRVTDEDILDWTKNQLQGNTNCISDVKLEEECMCSGDICQTNHICVNGNICIPDTEDPDCGTNIKTEPPQRFKRAFQINSRNEPGSWPWTVSIGRQSDVWEHLCGGVLATSNSVITVAHCHLPNEVKLGLIYIRAGDGNLKDDADDGNVQVIQVISFTTHPDFQSRARYTDIGVYKLATPFTLNRNVRTICLPTAPTQRDQENNLQLVVTGWGADENNRVGEELANFGAQVYAEEYCNQTYIGQLRNELAVPQGFTSDLFCAGDRANGDGACLGDSGNPAVFFQYLRNKYVLKGIVGGGLSCGTLEHPNIYIRITDKKILNWIRLQIWETSESSPAAVTIRSTVISTTTATESVIELIAQTDRTCPEVETCEIKRNCPYIRRKYREANAIRQSQKEEYKSIINQLKARICNKQKKAFCCPTN